MMATIEYYSIEIDGDKAVFRPGENVEGRITLKLGKGMRIKSLVAGFHGQGRVDYTVSKTHYINREEYFSDGRMLYDECQDPQLMGNFPPGEYAFPFSFRLPYGGLPTSFQGEYGYIRYWLDSTIQRPWRSNEKRQLAVTVVEPVNIDQPDLRSSRQNQDNRTVCCMCCAAGNLNVLGKIDKGAYYPGEELAAKMYVENLSSRNVTYTEVVLEQVITYKYGKGSDDIKKQHITVARVKGLGVPRHEEASIEDLRLTIPAFQPTTTSSNIISISYFIELIAHVQGACVFSSSIKIPIKLGRASSGTATGLSPEILRLIIHAINQELQESGVQEEREPEDDSRVDYDDREVICRT